jgi:hypothetical protein
LLTFNADLSYTGSSWHETFNALESIPLTCAQASDPQATCSGLSQTVKDTESTIVTSCSGSTTCSCRISGTLSAASGAGTYTTSTTLLDLAGSMTAHFGYCVDGDLLHLMQLSATLDSSGQQMILSDLVAQRATP